ncbi:hypothetical protein TVAG_440550 [Trichomonas vaginalis G3]|uniref:Uncharacterized protein n=1 Tax=Trichomonas vaginalis (strain ATCC PRA-98 / G3) TaxID=412133 RepID=A2F1L1_TRIV3|nr:hypothetical protein TVAGG3_0369260 [Trichomonas vaginalis G3]EAY01229.1 hypothetical protein TVAG_440550 [Trichomonas vaginalis G3]KAI5532491.1 hypothetical protein TVAGG3_0369260 [Trichomonas vaginalis G3]|eukprot:XP_001330145.1 hypothetical protein [Trichomonas vaginalis G3]
MHELLRLDGLYYHNSPNHGLFSIINKFENLLNVNTLNLPASCYPTKEELQDFSVKMMELPMIPLQSNLKISPRRRFSTDIQNYSPVTQYTETAPERFVSATAETTPRRKQAPILKIAFPKRKIRVPNKQINHSMTLASFKHASTPNKYYRVTASTDFIETEPVVTAVKTKRRANSVRKDNSDEPKRNLAIRAPDTPKSNPRFSKV